MSGIKDPTTKLFPGDVIPLGGSDTLLSEPIEENVGEYLTSLKYHLLWFEGRLSENYHYTIKNQKGEKIITPFKEQYDSLVYCYFWEVENDKHRLLVKITDGENRNQLLLFDKAYSDLCDFQEKLLKKAFERGISMSFNPEVQILKNKLTRHLNGNLNYINNDLSKAAMGIKEKYAERPFNPLAEYPNHFTSKEAFLVFKDFKEKYVLNFWPDHGFLYHRLKNNGLIKKYTQAEWFKILTEELLVDIDLDEIKGNNSDWATHYFGSEKNLNYNKRPEYFKNSFKEFFPDKECLLYPKSIF